MISNYLLLAWRNLTANKTVSFINIFGLSIAVACCVTVFLFLKNYWSLDNFHVNGDRIFIAEYVTDTDGQNQTWGDAPPPLAAALTNDFPQVERTVRLRREGVVVSSGDNAFEETLACVDTGFFQMFTFPLALGSPAVLRDPAALILSAQMAEKYFPGSMPIGQTLTLILEGQQRKTFTVQGVAAPFPDNADLRFDLLTGYYPAKVALGTGDWATGNGNVFVQLRQATDAPVVAAQMSRYLPLFNAHNAQLPATSFTLDNLKNPAPQAYDVNRRPAEAPHPIFAGMLSAIALLLLSLSCFNYVNISLGAATRRLKEIGVRKVMGGNRWQLVAQFMAENLLLCFFALVLGLLLCQTVFAPMMNQIMVLQLGLSLGKNAELWLFLVGLLVLTGLASGAYPALYVSNFRPTAIFSGKQKFGGNSTFRRGLLTVQFALAFVAVIVSVVVLTAGKHWSSMAWGYHPEQTLVLQLTDSTQYSLLRNELLKNPNVQRVAGASLHVGQNYSRESVQVGADQSEAFRFDVGAGYAEALGLELESGRFFEENRSLEDQQSVLVSETFVKKQGWPQALGQQVRVAEKTYTVAGVVRDFKMFGTGAIRPAVFFRSAEPGFGYLTVRFAPGTGSEVETQLKKDYQRLFGSAPLNVFFQSEVFDSFNRSFWGLAQSFGYIAGLALLIACLGLYGLATQQFARRMKEVSVRKLLGASASRIVLLVNREFIAMLLLAGGLATALCVVVVRLVFSNLEQFTGAYQPGVGPFLLANVLVFTTAAVAIGRHSWQLTRVRLAETLKNNE